MVLEMISKRFCIVSSLFTLLLVSLFSELVLGQQLECSTKGWPSDSSDLLPDPALKRGTLANGFRYVIVEHNEPQDRVALYLNVMAGSLHEEDDQKGVAHFLEHMMFNGSTNFKPGELVEFFQSIGMNYGGDTNAFTSFDSTVYTINLPDSTESSLRKGLLVLSDYARGASLLESEVERERGVILAEQRARDSARYRSLVASASFRLKGTLFPERFAIGDIETIKSADRDLLKRYYDSWYRPENQMVVVVGNVETKNVKNLIQQYFSPINGVGEVPDCPEFGKVQTAGIQAFYYHEKELGSTEVSIESLWNEAIVEDTYASQKENLYRNASILLMQNRLDKLVEKKAPLMTGSNYSNGVLMRRIGYSAIDARTEPENWQQTLEALYISLQTALKFGFHPQEFEIVKKDLKQSLKTAVIDSPDRKSTQIAMAIIGQFNAGKVVQSPQQELELLLPLIEKMTVEDVNTMLRKGWDLDNILVSVVGNAGVTDVKSDEQVKAAYLALQKIPVEPVITKEQPQFPYLKVPDADRNQIVSSSYFKEVDAHRIVLKNNVTITFKKTDFETDRINIVVNAGDGQHAEPQPGLSMLASSVINGSGTGLLTRTELNDVLAGSTVNVGFRIGVDSLKWNASSVVTDTELLLQIVHALLQDPGMSDKSYQRTIKKIKHFYNSLENNLRGAERKEISPFLANYDPRVSLPPVDLMTALTLDDIKNWLEPEIRSAPMEIAIVGDFDLEHIQQLSVKYFGTLPVKQQWQPKKVSLTFPNGKELRVEIESSIDKSLLVTAWPTDDFWNIQQTRRLRILADVFEERLRKLIREQLGATYTTTVYSTPSRIFENYGKLIVRLVVEPGREKEIQTEIEKAAEHLRVNGIEQKELDNIVVPLGNSLRDMTKTNTYWLYSVLALSARYPQKIQWAETFLADYASITTAEIDGLAKKYLVAEKLASAMVVQKK